jgi:uncharacterized protein
MQVIILKDERPGHYHQSEGVALAMSKLGDTKVERVQVIPRNKPILRYLRKCLVSGWITPQFCLRLAYKPHALPTISDDVLLVSAGGDTLLANVCHSKINQISNVFIGSTRGLPDSWFSAIHLIYERFRDRVPYVVTLKPNSVDPDHGDSATSLDQGLAGRKFTLLVGGATRTYKFTAKDWERLVAFVLNTGKEWGVTWSVSTSRRTSGRLAEKLLSLSQEHPDIVTNFIDYSMAGPGSARDLMFSSDVIVCTEDSNSMLTESICARRPVVSLQPDLFDGSEDEKEYLVHLEREGWMVRVKLSGVDLNSVKSCLQSLTPMQENHLELLAEKIADRLGISYRTKP